MVQESRMDTACLPHLEETITQITVELLLAEKEKRFPHLILDNPHDKTCTRMTMHYVRALLSYGFSPDTEALQAAINWFDRPFPLSDNDHVDPKEMNRLLVLLLTRPQQDNVAERLRQLGSQRVEDGFDVQPGWGGFDTLWTLEVFALARLRGVLKPEHANWDELSGYMHRIINRRELRRDKDLALALRLQHEHFGGLKPEHETELDRLIQALENNKGVWGLEEIGWLTKRMTWLREYQQGSKLLPAEVREYQEQFRRVILSTCMVIEYLAPLRETYPRLRRPLENAMHLWWTQIEGEHAVTTLRSLFPKPHDFDYLRVLCRTLRAVRSYVDAPLGTLNAVQVHVLQELAELKKDLSESAETRNIKTALHSWLRVELERESERLKLGFSDANVVRAFPVISGPVSGMDGRPIRIGSESVIIKYGPRDEIETERRNYGDLPGAVRDFFVSIPEPTYTNAETGTSYLILQDLNDYQTLYEIHEAIAHNVTQVADQLGNFLLQMHRGGTNTVQAVPKSLVREIYLRKMMEYIDRIFDFTWEYKLFEKNRTTQDIHDDLFDCIGDLIRRQVHLRDFPAALMHGDLHLRNIMLRGLDPHHNRPNMPLTFKLIDLEYMNIKGDAAFDAGQLLMDIELISREERRFDSQEKLLRLRDQLHLIYEDFGKARNDSTFGIRMELAKARALLRIAKGKTKRGRSYLKERQSVQAAHIGEEVVSHAAEALQYLQSVTSALN
jgi:hypothetical protein